MSRNLFVAFCNENPRRVHRFEGDDEVHAPQNSLEGVTVGSLVNFEMHSRDSK
jgi:hypothetical protein